MAVSREECDNHDAFIPDMNFDDDPYRRRQRPCQESKQDTEPGNLHINHEKVYQVSWPEDEKPYLDTKIEKLTAASSDATHEKIEPRVMRPTRTHSYLPYTNHKPELDHPNNTFYFDPPEITLSDPHGAKSMLSVTNASMTRALLLDSAERRSPILPTTTLDAIQNKKNRKRRNNKTVCWCCLTRVRTVVTISTISLVALVLVWFFCWPRSPDLKITGSSAQTINLPADWGPDQQPWLRATWLLNVTLNNAPNWIPTRLKADLTLIIRPTDVPFGYATFAPTEALAPHTNTSLQLPFAIQYNATSKSDPTFQLLYDACGPKKMGGSSLMDMALRADFHLWGIAWTQSTIAVPKEFTCPTT
ncbi:hypothetical protein BCR43DRAFT_523048 [Syncephalastrum racemosum]|uniref:Late embryogenesis abundant protein LEA-2 subgroup domain-containing protein n=1 Tax=Syncephalastrum racemosum TaxID=13706 RepID=A0A1X2HIY8_SYNRA|nr:hypothetical protein BCR43DRAFT_523048 [Syncephalastrum racemosum]